MKKTVIAIAVLATGLAAAAPETALAAFRGAQGTIRISGGTAHIPVMKEAAKRIMTSNPDVRISIAGGGSGVGIQQAGEGLVDLGNAGRAATDQEVGKYGLVQTKWAIDGVGVVVHPGNPVGALTGGKLIEVFAGRITNWKDLGGPDRPIAVYTRDEASGTREVFWKKALEKGAILARANVVSSNGAMKTAVGGNPNAIGYVSVGHIDSSVKAVAVDGIAPTLDNVKSGRYAIARGLYSNTKGEPRGLAAKLLGYLLSEEGQALVGSKGFVPVN
jgi:phosphate transport system substrate-binding protein